MKSRAMALASIGALFAAAATSGVGMVARPQRTLLDDLEPEEPKPQADSKSRRVRIFRKSGSLDHAQRQHNAAKFKKGDTLGIPKEDLERLKAAQERRESRAARRGS